MPLNERPGSIFQLCSHGMGVLAPSKLQQCHRACFSHRTRHCCAMDDSSTSQPGCLHTYNFRIRSLRVVCSAQHTVCTKGQSAVIQPFLLPGIQQQLSQTHAHWEGQQHRALLSSEYVQEAGEQAETIKEEKIFNCALTVYVQIAGWSLVHLKRPICTVLTGTHRENKHWGRINKQLG